MALTIKEVCEKFWNIEEKYELNHMEIQNIYPWQLIRVQLFSIIKNKLGISKHNEEIEKYNNPNAKLLKSFIKSSLLYKPESGKQKDVLIFDYPKKVFFNEEYQDIYSYFIPKTLDKFNQSYELIESPYLNKHYTPNWKKKDKNGNRYIKYNDKILIESYIHRNKNKIEFTEEELNKINLIEQDIENSFSDIESRIIITIDLEKIIEDSILNFKFQYKKYLEIFEAKKPKKIIIIHTPENKSIIAAAKEKNIEVIELQHEIINKYNLSYNYPKKTMHKNGKVKEIAYFPDKMLTFGEYWNTSCSYPIKSENIITMGFPYFRMHYEKYKLNNKNKNQILFISEQRIGKDLTKIAYNLAMNLAEKEETKEIILKEEKEDYEDEINKETVKIPIDIAVKKATSIGKNKSKNEIIKLIDEMKEEIIKNKKDKKQKIKEEKERKEWEEFNSKEKYEIVYKLSPEEYKTWNEDYLYLNKALEINGPKSTVTFKIIKEETTDYKLFADSEYCINLNPKSIYKSLAFGCKTFIIEDNENEYVEDLITKNIINKINSVDELIKDIKNREVENKNYEDYFFDKYNENIFLNIF